MHPMHSRKRSRLPTSDISPRKVQRTAIFEEATLQAIHAGQITEGLANVKDDGAATIQESSIPTPSLLKMPFELSIMITELLSPADLRNLRRTCRWADSQTYDLFAKRTFTNIHARSGHHSARRLAQTFQGHEHLATYAQTFTISYGSIDRPLPCPTDLQCVWTFSGVISKLRNLRRLELRDITSQAVLCQFLRQHVPINDVSWSQTDHLDHLIYTTPGTNWPQLTTLWIRSAQLTKQDIRLLVRLAGPGLRNLKVSQIKCTNGKWLDVLRELLGTSPGLERLELGSLSDGTESWEPYLGPSSLRGYKRFGATNLHKAIRGPKGIEVVVVHQFDAYMTGSQAVKFGLETIIERFAG
ncbi:hypothetical protein LTR56_004784 [Elasticomyces elasticus]|nr:hypothetical protein LTR56_004784 [Elasticomyces elasticus]KAK3665640.1 hypothetical protein LTR22_003580 [Elasticomyces elasticus]KAK4930322.1 hypothetical protein LTR49_003063 [Elasticomyces elasticus]KAK5768951.1 hypothetical protein LTS12_001011 [Elasticomyces elasticus]